MAKLRCENITAGLRSSEAVAVFSDIHGRKHFIRVERDFLYDEGESKFLPVGVVHVDAKSKYVLIELPHEAEAGANRLWIKPDQLSESVEAFA